MEKIIRGKYLVRTSKLSNGESVMVIAGVFRPMNFDINDLHPKDEMWVSDLVVSPGGIRFKESVFGQGAGSPEDFLSGDNQRPEDWRTRENL